MKTNLVKRSALHAIAAIVTLLATVIPVGIGAGARGPVHLAEASASAIQTSAASYGTAASDNTTRYSITVSSVSGGPESSPPLYYSGNISLSGSVSANGYAGQLAQYDVQIDWGDGNVSQHSTINLTASNGGKDFTGTWASNPTHLYAQSGNYTITARLYHATPPGNDGAADSFSKVGAVMVVPPVIVGIVFNDLNGNGAWDSGEPGIGGAGISVTGTANFVTTTSSTGLYRCDNLSVGPYVVTETDLPGYMSTTPNMVQLLSTSAGHVYEVNFGDRVPSSDAAFIEGTVYSDSNGNQTRDQDELGIAGAVLSLNDSLHTESDKYGRYSFQVASSGNYTVSEIDPAGYYSSTPNDLPVEVVGGNSYQRDFGDTSLATCVLALSPKTANNQLPGAASETLTVTLRDQHGTGISGKEVSLTTTFGSLSTSNVTTGAGGAGTFSVSSSAAGKATLTATLGPLSDTAQATWLPAVVSGGGGNGGGGGGSGGFPPAIPTPAPTPTKTPEPEPTAAASTIAPPKVQLFFTVDFLGKITIGLMSEDGSLLESIDAYSPDGSQLLRLSSGTRTRDSQGQMVTKIVVREAAQAPALPENMTLVGRAYDFTPTGTTFDGKVGLTLAYDVNALPKQIAFLGIGCYQATSGWEKLATEQNRVAGVGNLSAPVPHLSIFAVLASAKPASFRAMNLGLSPSHKTLWPWLPLVQLNGQQVVISADVVNEGGQTGNCGLSLTIDNRIKGQKEITVAASETGSVTFNVEGLGFGRHTVRVGDLTGQFATTFSINWWPLAALMFVSAVFGWLISWYLIARVKRSRRQENA